MRTMSARGVHGILILAIEAVFKSDHVTTTVFSSCDWTKNQGLYRLIE